RSGGGHERNSRISARMRPGFEWDVCAMRTSLHALLTLLVWPAGCHEPPPAHTAPASPPAKVENPVPETRLTTVVLTPEAEKRLGIRVEPVAVRPTARSRLFGGEALTPPGRSIAVHAPIAGLLSNSDTSQEPVAVGARVTQNQTVFRLLPVLSS